MKKDPLITSLANEQTKKTDERIHFFGTTDYLSSSIMELVNMIEDDNHKQTLIMIVKTLSKIMGIVSGYDILFGEEILNDLLKEIKRIKKSPDILTSFVLPGTNLLNAKIHIVRTISRMSELDYAKVYELHYQNSDSKYNYIFEYLNKLSTYFYELSFSYE